MAEYFAEHGISNTLSAFKDQLGHLSYSAAYQKLNNWRNDMISQRELHQPGRPPNYGEYILLLVSVGRAVLIHSHIVVVFPLCDGLTLKWPVYYFFLLREYMLASSLHHISKPFR
jgi:hypothetical protein